MSQWNKFGFCNPNRMANGSPKETNQMTFLGQSATKEKSNSFDHCQLETQELDCGSASAHCESLRTGNRCRCITGRMGIKCQRPCQDVYHSCKQWKLEGRCNWAIAFFTDNCALSCSRCQSNGKVLLDPLPPALESLEWIVGLWETEVNSRVRFPSPTSYRSGYVEIVNIQTAAVNMFDRPTLNISVIAQSLNGSDVYNELGFISMRSISENVDKNETHKYNQVAIELVSNTGISTIEEGVLMGTQIELQLTRKLQMHDGFLSQAKRRFRRLNKTTLEERVVLIGTNGKRAKHTKRFRLIEDHLSNLFEF
ncbi:hypothetical protein M3Y98_00154600 [Aphelenchoides besseyi]|nr:hypothetical protein M3Y98_00154600 [Aphelenchoides besseyi]KAI6199833.1 hypothetical protein M3Y96_00668900 [Aphelenchoides besseyi]